MSVADLFCFSPLRFNAAMRALTGPFARDRRVFFVEAPHYGARQDGLSEQRVGNNLWRITPRLMSEQEAPAQMATIGRLLLDLCERHTIVAPAHWHLTPVTLPLAAQLPRSLVVYDSIDEMVRPANVEHLDAERAHAATFSADANAHAWREAAFARMHRFVTEAENAAAPTPRRSLASITRLARSRVSAAVPQVSAAHT